MQRPLVSIIMPAYNSNNYIASSIASVISQDYQNWELIIVDDFSKDETFKIISAFSEKDKRIKVFRNKSNRGAGFSRNKALKEANGEFIAFLDADDLWKKEKLSKQLNFCLENKVNIVYSSYEKIDEQGKLLKQKIESLPFVNYQKLMRSNYIGNLTGMYNAAKIGKIYLPEIRKRQDWAMWLAVVEKGGTAHGIEDSLAFYRIRKGSVSENKFAMLSYNFKIYNQVLGFGKLKSLYWMFVFLGEHFLVKSKQTVSFD
ncbi:glycosyltransferase family 2 protein [Zunongwangia sp. HRR-M8]|uniref:glycosyltransferase family 2 protein n=1 Tax=Zunongwangia sp. HRR-M8 TaxID=3015170 RepID=UPI0022DE81AF|nr:glycosyltransferase family 2 protein [Zunongwangia sp. HRR-M8]WBL22394.1 glycosyltransferase family 2 protein [Zunongwangia sp. HRR-M8]